MVTLTAAEEAQVVRIREVQRLRHALSSLTRAQFQAFVDSLPADDEQLAEARAEAERLVVELGRSGERARACELAEIGAHDAGERPLGLRQIRTADDYEPINTRDFDRARRLAERARDHALAIVVGDRLPAAALDRLRLLGGSDDASPRP